MLRLIQRHASVGYLAAAAGTLVWVLPAAAAHTVTISVTTIAFGVAVLWIASGAWRERERWAVRLQSALVALIILPLIVATPSASVAVGGLLVFTVAVTFLSLAHIIGQALADIRDRLRSGTAFSLTEGARQSLFFSTFAAPIAVGLIPGPVTVAAVLIVCALVNVTVATHTSRRLSAGIARASDDA
jgi:hypothetical protein